ncbi:hypothetical protein B0J14DRAFT_608849 [Halenospora varia]|nr:hypothetical protein B0J14DRAFT_608849 [Halenospora varia]
MRRVYRNAHRVLVCLGSDDEDMRDAMNYLSFVSKLFISETANPSDEEQDNMKPRKPEASQAPLLSRRHDRVSQMTRLIGLPWFSRRWIIQKVVLNSDVSIHYGLLDFALGTVHSSYEHFMHFRNT